MMESQRSRRAVRRTVSPGARCGVLLLILSALVLIAAPLATATASAAVLASRSGDPLAVLSVQQAELNDPLAAVRDDFGSAVALSGATALVAAPDKTVDGHAGAGIVYVYTRTGTTWSQQAQLNDPAAATNDNFGYAVALDGDTALVGAWAKTVSGQTDAGAAYVYTRTGTTWTRQATLNDPAAAAWDSFGISVALSGNTALVNAEGKTVNGHVDAGVVYVYTRTGTTWSQQAALSASDAAAHDSFGWPMTLSGGTALIAAAYRTVDGQSNAGAVYVFKRTGASWLQQAELSDPDAAANDYFGWSVALSGDTALVGADGKTVSGQSQAGAAYVYTRSGTTWSQQTELTASDGAVHDSFGVSVALDGAAALVGADSRTVGGYANAGAAYVFTRTGTTWSQQTELSASDAATDDSFGYPVALSGDTALIGACNKTVSGQSQAGVVYVDALSGLPPWLSLKAKPASIKVGKSVTLSGLVKHFLAADKTVQIERKAGSKLTALKTLKLTNSGAFTWATKPNKTGKWVFEAAYESGGVSYASKPVTVKVHK